jgi:hypothetical protein
MLDTPIFPIIKMCFSPEKNSQFPEDMEKSSELSAFLGPLGPLGYNISP